MDLGSLIDTERVRCDVEARSKKHALEILSEMLSKGEPTLAAQGVFDSLVQRERLGSTAVGSGAAIPHGRLPDIGETRVALLRLSEPIDFDAVDGEPVQLIFGLVIPDEGSDEEHLELLSSIATLLRDPTFNNRATAAPGRKALFQLVASQSGSQPADDGDRSNT